jgi:hypothetical protein
MTGSLDNFLHYLRLNIFKQIISVEPIMDKSLIKCPNHLILRSTELTQPLPNLAIGKFFSLILDTNYQINLQFTDFGKPHLKSFDSLAQLRYYNSWRPVDVLCEIVDPRSDANSVLKHFLV